MRQAFIHIGTPKTGTTSLQRFLYSNRKVLPSRGICYPIRTDWKIHKHSNIYAEVNGLSGFDPSGNTLELVRNRLSRHQPDIVILSNEKLSDSTRAKETAAKLYDFFHDLGYAVRIVAGIRPQHDYINSWYSQQVKGLRELARFEDYVTRIVGADTSMFDLDTVFRPWEQLPDTEFIAVPFLSGRQRFEAGGNSVTDFCRAIGIEDRIADLSAFRRAEFNPRPGPMTLEISRRLVELADRRIVKSRRAIAHRIERFAAATGRNEGTFQGLTPELFDRIGQRFAASNDRFSQRVWGKPFDAVFDPIDPSAIRTNAIDAKDLDAEELEKIAAFVRTQCRKFRSGNSETAVEYILRLGIAALRDLRHR